MSRADRIFIDNMKDILENGVWDTDYPVRPHWADGAPAHTIKKFGIVNRYDLQEELPILTIRRTAFKSCLDELLRITSMTSIAISGIRGRMKRGPSARPMDTSLPKNRFIPKANSTKWIASFSI